MFLVLGNIKYGLYLSAAVFILASSTDALDGYIARSRNQVTNFGKFIDPLADKLLITAAILALVQMNKVPAWIAFIIISRDLMVNLLRMCAASEGVVIQASPVGKIKTIFQIIAIIVLLIDSLNLYVFNLSLGLLILYIAMGLTVVSGFDYLYKGLGFIKD